MNDDDDGDNHEDETASMHLLFLPLDTLTLPYPSRSMFI